MVASVASDFFNKECSGANTSGNAFKSRTMLNRQFAKELCKPIIRKFEKGKVCFSKDNIYGSDLEDMQLKSKFNKRFRLFFFLLLIFMVNM